MDHLKLRWQMMGTLLVLVLLAGCGAPATAPMVTRAALTPTIEADWTLHEKPADGFAIALPPTWVQIDMYAETMEAALQSIKTDRPDLQLPFLERQDIRDLRASGVRFIGFDVDSEVIEETGAVTSVNITMRSLDEEVTLDEVVLAAVESYKTDAGSEPTHRRVKLYDGEAGEVRVRAKGTTPTGQEMVIAITQYFIVNGKDAYVITLGTPVDLQGKYAIIFEKIGQSFRLIK